MRIVIILKKDISSAIIINKLYKNTALQNSFGVILLSIVDGIPKILGLKDILANYILHRKIVVTRRTEYELRRAEERAHILEGLKIALDNIDEVIAIIKSSKNTEEASKKLIRAFELSVIQTKAILEMRLQRLTGLEVKKIVDDILEQLESEYKVKKKG